MKIFIIVCFAVCVLYLCAKKYGIGTSEEDRLAYIKRLTKQKERR